MLKFNKNNIPELEFKKAIKKPIALNCIQIRQPFEVQTMEGLMLGKKGDWLMIGVEGEIYPCDKSIFEKTYDLVK
jgi:hypothetical protein